MIAEKKSRTDLAVPSWVGEEFGKGTVEKNKMATLLMELNYDKDYKK